MLILYESDIRGEAERVGIDQPAEEKAQRGSYDLINVINTWQKAIKKSDADYSQWYPVKGQEAMGTN